MALTYPYQVLSVGSEATGEFDPLGTAVALVIIVFFVGTALWFRARIQDGGSVAWLIPMIFALMMAAIGLIALGINLVAALANG